MSGKNIEQENTQQKKYSNPLGRRIFIGCLFFVLIICVIMGFIGFYIFENSMMHQYEVQLTEIINLTVAKIDVEDLKSCIETGEESDKYIELITFMDQLRQNTSVDHIVIVTPIKEGGTYDVIQVASGLLPEERNGQNLKDIAVPLLGDRMGDYYPPEFLPEIYNRLQNYHEINFSESENEFGRTYTGAVSIFDKNGEPVALVTSGLSLNYIESTMKWYAVIVSVVTIILCGIVLAVMMLWFRKHILNPIHQIEQTAREFEEKSRAQKNPDVLVLDLPEINSGDELESLSNTLYSMSLNMKQYVVDLLTSSIKMDILERDLVESKKRAKELGELATLDSLTGIRNKTAYDIEVLEISEAIQQGDIKFGVAMIDLNFLKRINDTYGHKKGNIAIQRACHLACDTFKHSPLFRVGGDEFIAILKGYDYENIESLVEKFNKEVEHLSNDTSLEPWERTSAAIGYALYDEKMDTSYETVFHRADKAMYECKKAMKALRE